MGMFNRQRSSPTPNIVQIILVLVRHSFRWKKGRAPPPFPQHLWQVPTQARGNPGRAKWRYTIGPSPSSEVNSGDNGGANSHGIWSRFFQAETMCETLWQGVKASFSSNQSNQRLNPPHTTHPDAEVAMVVESKRQDCGDCVVWEDIIIAEYLQPDWTWWNKWMIKRAPIRQRLIN